MTKPHPTGGTFAERAAAAAGESSFKAPATDTVEAQENTTFAERGGKGVKAVEPDSDGAENKAVAKKAASKKS